MPVFIPAPPTNERKNEESTSYLNRYNYYRVPVNLGRESGKAEYDYFLDINISTGKYALPKKVDYQLPPNHLSFDELEDSEGVKGVISARTIEANIFYFGGAYNNYAAKCRSDSYLADIEHIESLPITDEDKENYKRNRPRIKGIWMMPFRGSSYDNDNNSVINYYQPHGISRGGLTTPDGTYYEAGQVINCAECGLCFKKFDNEFKDLKGRTEYYLYMIITKVGKTKLKQAIPVKLVCTGSSFPSIHNLLYTLSAADPTKEIEEHTVRLSLEAVLGRDGKPLPNCYSILGEIIGEIEDHAAALITEIIELNTYKPDRKETESTQLNNTVNSVDSNSSNKAKSTTKTNTKTKVKANIDTESEDDDFDF